MELNVWLYCQSLAKQRAHADQPPWQQPEIFPHDCNSTLAVATEEPDIPRHKRTTSSSKHTAAASRVPTVLGWTHLADHESVDSRQSIRETGADRGRETVVSTFFRSESKGKRNRDINVVQSVRDRANLKKKTWAESWKCRLKQENCSAKNEWNWGRKSGEILGKEKFGHCSSWDQSGVRISTISATTKKSMGKLGSKRQNQLVWRIGIEKESSKKSC